MTPSLVMALPWVSAVVAMLALPLALVGVGFVRAYALRRGVLDVPNVRSSHARPTPRGGGLGWVVATLVAGGIALGLAGVPQLVIALAALAVAAVAVVGWLDDHRSLRVSTRLVVHVAAAIAVATIADRSSATWASGGSLARAISFIAWTFGTASAINVINFVDGIDGIIGAQLLIFGSYAMVLAPLGTPAWVFGLTVSAASLGFLAYNWAPARIFLGDVGSGPAGVVVVLLGITLVATPPRTDVARAFIPLYPIFLDAAVTLLRRFRAGERVTVPHRSHLYQRLANGPWSHARTAATFAAVSIAGAAVGAVKSPELFATLGVAYLISVPLIGTRLERHAPWVATARVA